MKRNPLIPFALIAALGIIVMFVFSFQGLNKSKELADAKWREASTNSIKARGYCEAKLYGDISYKGQLDLTYKNWWETFKG